MSNKDVQTSPSLKIFDAFLVESAENSQYFPPENLIFLNLLWQDMFWKSSASFSWAPNLLQLLYYLDFDIISNLPEMIVTSHINFINRKPGEYSIWPTPTAIIFNFHWKQCCACMDHIFELSHWSRLTWWCQTGLNCFDLSKTHTQFAEFNHLARSNPKSKTRARPHLAPTQNEFQFLNPNLIRNKSFIFSFCISNWSILNNVTNESHFSL